MRGCWLRGSTKSGAAQVQRNGWARSNRIGGEVLTATKSLPESSAAIESRDRWLFQARKAEDTWSPGKSITHEAVIRGEATAGIGCPVHMIGAVLNPFLRCCFARATSSFGAELQDLPGSGLGYLVSPSSRHLQGRILGWLDTTGRALKH